MGGAIHRGTESVSSIFVIGMAILCVIVVGQVLGSQITLWEPTEQTDERNGSMFGWILPSSPVTFSPRVTVSYWQGTRPSSHLSVPVVLFFHPPE